MTQLLDPPQADLLRAAFGRHDEAVRAWQGWRDSIDWEGHLDPDAFALLPAVYRNLHRFGVDDALFPRIKGIMRQSWLHNQQRIAALRATLKSCERHQVEVMLLPPMSLWLIDSQAVSNPAQPYSLAVVPEHAEPAIHSLYAAGWRSRQVRLPAALLPGYVRGARHLVLENGAEECLILTWGLEHWFDARASAVWSRSHSGRLAQHPVRTLDPTDAFEFALRQTSGTWLRRIGDVLAVQAAAAGIEWERLVRELHTSPLPCVWADALRCMQPFLADGCDPPLDLHQFCRDRPSATTNASVPRSWATRARQDWAAYRRRWSEHYPASTAVRQLPGYLIGRWHLSGAAQLPRGLYRWLRYKPYAEEASPSGFPSP